jgi:hypothetical protein
VEFDDLIDGALKSYVAQEPREGLENRILCRVRADRRRPSRFSRWLGLAVSVLAGVAVVLVISKGHREEKRPVLVPPVQVWMRELPPAPHPVVVHRVGQIRQPDRRRSVFPSAAPLTNQERALMAFAAIAPAETVAAFIEERDRNPAPIKIDSIEIAPLQSNGAP